MGKHFLRTYREYDLEEISKHLLILGDLTADCASCRELGLDPYSAAECPNCKATFKYAASRRIESHSGERFQIIRRMQEKRPDLIFIDLGDYEKAVGHKKARDFFG